MFSHALLCAALAAAPLELPPLQADQLRVFLVRHGQAYSNLNPAPALSVAELDRLTDAGREQLTASAKLLANQKIARILTSPANRAQQSAAHLAGLLRLGKPEVNLAFRSIEVGNLPDGSELPFQERISAWRAGQDPIPPGGESMEQMGARVRAALLEAAPRLKGKAVIVVAHSEVIASALGDFAGTPPAQRFPWKIPNASVSVVDLGPNGAVVHQVGRSP